MTQPDQDTLDDLWRPHRQPNAGLDLLSTPSGGVPVRPRPTRRRFGKVLNEALIAAVLSFGTAAAMGWQVLRSVRTVVPGGGADPWIEVWSLAWSGHALKPGSGVSLTQLFDGNAFYPADYSLAFTDSLLGYGPLTWFVHSVGGLVMIYNLIFVFSPALSALGGYALARQLGAHPVGAAVAAAGYAYAPWHTGQFSHLHVLSTGPLVIGLAMLARGHGFTFSGVRTPIRPGWVLLGWLVGAWQLTIGFANGLPFGYLLAVIAVLVILIAPVRLFRERRARRRPVEPDPAATGRTRSRPITLRWLLLADLFGGALFAAVGGLMGYPYLRVESIDPNAVATARGLIQVAAYSPHPIDLITPPSIDGTWSWLTAGQTLTSGTNEVRVMPGAILLFLAVLGLLISTWRWWWRLTLALAVLVIGSLALGTHFPDAAFPGPDAPFVLLWRDVEGWAADRTPGRLTVFATLGLALLAAGAASRLAGWGVLGYRGKAPRARAALFAVLPVLIVLEGWANVPVMRIPATPRAVTAAVGPMVVLPSVWTNDSVVMFWTATRGFPQVANGQSGITPSTLIHMRLEMINFPDQRSVTYLRANGFHSVAVLRQPLGTTLWPNAGAVPDPALGLTRTDLGDSVLFTVGPAPNPALTTPTPTPSLTPTPAPSRTSKSGPIRTPNPGPDPAPTSLPTPTAS
jgi:hypothetical protein